MMNASATPTKVSGLDLQINFLAKILFCFTTCLAAVMVLLPPDHSPSPLLKALAFSRFVLLFSSIVPISLRVSLEMAKVTYALAISNDPEMRGAVVRSSSISEELGGIEYLLTDKTGTLTRNEMVFRKLHLGSHCLSSADTREVSDLLAQATRADASGGAEAPSHLAAQARDALLAIALCHNVSPVEGGDSFQGASPDELALVSFAASAGLLLVSRDLRQIVLRRGLDGAELAFDILHEFPFTSETKRMGIVLRCRQSGTLTFYAKGADVAMADKVARSYWLEEEVGNLAREGLRTLVVARRRVSEGAYRQFEAELQGARLAKSAAGREQGVRSCVERLEVEMELLCLTAVEDLLQPHVQQTLEKLRNANVRTWMLTGDKLETAMVIAQNASLVPRGGAFYALVARSPLEALQKLRGYPQGVMHAPCLLVDGASLELCLAHHRILFLEVACAAPAVVCCRCSPTQKAQIVRLIRSHTGKCTAAIGDGGNDIPMIREAHVGIGIEGKEGKQASMAADFSLLEFSHLQRLVLWHGRNAYLRSALLAQFVIHRGLIIAMIQAVFSSLFFFASIAVFNGYLTVGYATIFTTGPVFSLVLDEVEWQAARGRTPRAPSCSCQLTLTAHTRPCAYLPPAVPAGHLCGECAQVPRALPRAAEAAPPLAQDLPHLDVEGHLPGRRDHARRRLPLRPPAGARGGDHVHLAHPDRAAHGRSRGQALARHHGHLPGETRATHSPRRRGRASGSDAGTRCPRGVRPAERRAPTPFPRAPLRLGRC